MNALGRQEIRVSAGSENPYSAPKVANNALAGVIESKTVAHLSFHASAWVLSAALVLSFLWDLTGMLSQGPSVPNPASKARILMLVLIATAQVAMVVFMRWIVFRLMMRKVNPVGWGGAARCIVGAFVIYGMVKVLEITGVRLWSDSGRWFLYLCFAASSFILAALVVPSRLVEYVSSGKMRPAGQP